MKFIIGKIQSGKTTELIRMASKLEDCYIIVLNTKRANWLFDYSKKYGIKINFPITISNVFRKQYNQKAKSFLIDDIEDVLQNILNIPILAITGTEVENETV